LGYTDRIAWVIPIAIGFRLGVGSLFGLWARVEKAETIATVQAMPKGGGTAGIRSQIV